MSADEFSDWFRKELRRRRWRQADFVRESGISKGTVSQWFRGTRVPEPDSCDRIAEALHIDRDVVLDKAGHRQDVEEIPVDDPRRELHALIDRIQWDDWTLEIARGFLENLLLPKSTSLSRRPALSRSSRLD
jgi:transcriptional regulator with XRE-family HTH domain